MKKLLLIAFGVTLFAFTGQQASAQYPFYGEGYNGYGHGGHYTHHDHHYSVPAPLYQPSYASSYGAYGIGNAVPPVYGAATPTPQYAPPVATAYYSNNYYGRPAHSHHSWHPGHYLLGHH
ncbi:MAG: hypothetical protein U0930_25870 [Pirellulales bacterium]